MLSRWMSIIVMKMRSNYSLVLAIVVAVMLILPAASMVISARGGSDIQTETDNGDPPVDKGEMHRNRVRNASAHGAATFLRVEDYRPWAVLVVNAADPKGVDLVTVDFENETLTINAKDENETNNVTILINKNFADEYLAESKGNLEINTTDAVNYEGMEESNGTAEGAVYVFHIEHFSTQTIELSQGNGDNGDDVPPVEEGETHRNRAENAAAHGAATFLRVEDYHPWAALVVNAGDPDGVDAVTVDFENETLTIKAKDSNHTNHVTILINKNFADEYLADSEGNLEINTSEAVNYEGLDEDNETDDGAMYVFHIEHFSTQTIELSQGKGDPPIDIPPVEEGNTHRNRAENAGAHGAATFLKVEGYEPWAALVVNPGDPNGVDLVTISFENDTLTIEATDSNETNNVTIVINKNFADEHLADSEGDLNIETSDAVNYEGQEESEDGEGPGMYVFHIEHFSTQTIEISAQDSIPFLGTPLMLIAIAIPVMIYAITKKEQ